MQVIAFTVEEGEVKRARATTKEDGRYPYMLVQIPQTPLNALYGADCVRYHLSKKEGPFEALVSGKFTEKAREGGGGGAWIL